MSFSTQVKLKGSDVIYTLDPSIKSYTLVDMGFQKTNLGNYKLERTLDIEKTTSYKLKIVINQTLNRFKMVILDATGFQKVNLFNGNHDQEKNQFNYMLNELSIKKVIKSK